MKAKILSLALLMGLSVSLMAQSTQGGPKNEFRGHQKESFKGKEAGGLAYGLNLTDTQKEAFKQSIMAMHKQIKPIRNELGEAMAHQKTLMGAENVDLAAINSNIDKIGALRIEIAKIQIKNRLDMRAQLTDEQRQKFDLFKDRRKQGKGQGGMQHNWGNKSEHPDM